MRWFARAALGLAVAAVAVLGNALPAAAHVTVVPEQATQGENATLTLRVPNEKASASTVKIEVTFPEEVPVASVSVRPVPGWTTQVQRRTLDAPVPGPHGTQITDVVASVTWTAAAGSGIAPDQFQEFDITVGPLPVAERLVFKTLQHYSDGEIVRWIEDTPGVPLEYPAPVLHLQPATAPQSDDEDGGVALGFGIAGAVLGLAGLVLGLLAYRRSGVSG